jgi:hypothetical protein
MAQPGSQPSPQIQRSDYHWNVNAPVFTTHAAKRGTDMETQTENVAMQSTDTSTQTENIVKFSNCGSQCEVIETKNIGIRCKLVPPTKSKYIQATVVVKHQGSDSGVQTLDTSTQVDRHELTIPTAEKAVWVKQSPGALGRHTQTYKVGVRDQKINTKHIITNSRGYKSRKIHICGVIWLI